VEFFYRSLVDAVGIPVYVYNNPRAVGYGVSPDLVRKLAGLGVRGIKDSSFDILVLANFLRKVKGPAFDVVLGTEAMFTAASALGIQAFIPGLGNAFPELCRALYDAAQAGDYAKARGVQETVDAVRDVMYEAGSSLVAVLAMLEIRGVCRALPRPPLPSGGGAGPRDHAAAPSRPEGSLGEGDPMPPADVVAVIDSGTTNSRVRVLRERSLLGAITVPVGVVDTAKTRSNASLKQGLRQAFHEALRDARISPGEVRHALAFGMITSELGVMEIPHLAAPVGIAELAAGMVRREAAEDFLPVPTYFIRGVKNRVESSAGVPDLPRMDFMRGEETQVMGLLALHPSPLPISVVVLSSHTKFISVDAAGRIRGSVTTLSGQLFAALSRETFLASALREEPGETAPPSYFDPAIVEAGYRIVTAGGLNRALLIPRFMQVLMRTRWYERKLFLESLIAGEDLRGLGDFETLGFPTATAAYLLGGSYRCAVYRHLIEGHRIFRGPVVEITQPEAIHGLGSAGALEILRHRPA
jgi:2-dehydro-3-deoxygalactonokinase